MTRHVTHVMVGVDEVTVGVDEGLEEVGAVVGGGTSVDGEDEGGGVGVDESDELVGVSVIVTVTVSDAEVGRLEGSPSRAAPTERSQFQSLPGLGNGNHSL